MLVTESHRASLDWYSHWKEAPKVTQQLLELHLLQKERKKLTKIKQLTIYMLLFPENSFSRLPLAPFRTTPLSFFFNIYFLACRVLVMTPRIFNYGMQNFNCGIWDQVPWPGIELGLPALGTQSFSHWTTRQVPAPLSNTLLCLHTW